MIKAIKSVSPGWKYVVFLAIVQVVTQIPFWLTWMVTQINKMEMPSWVAVYVVSILYFLPILIGFTSKTEKFNNGAKFFFYNIISFLVVSSIVGYVMLMSQGYFPTR